jgi:UDP-GlcNAc:undecaprenyl-phosphate GlcNAc-1-phosphate transferase
MIHYLLILVTALTFSILMTPLARRVALRIGVVSVPRSRDIHIAPVPLLGGIGIYVGFVLALLFLGDRAYVRELVGILLGATLISLFGFTDDRWGLSASVKMAGQVLAGVVLLLGGTQVNLFPIGVPIGGMHITLLPYVWLNWALTLAWVVGITNALNFLDNMDGLSGGVAAIAASFFLLLALMNEPQQVLVGMMAAALVGACVGFLRHNLNPATIFMGDTGSLFIGFVLAALAIKLRFLGNEPVITWMVPVFVLAVPIFDTTLVFVARLRRRVNPFTTAGKDHLSHRLVALGMTKREAVLTCYLLCGVAGMVGTFTTQANEGEAVVVGLLMLALLVTGVAWFERVCPSGVVRKPAAALERSTERA